MKYEDKKRKIKISPAFVKAVTKLITALAASTISLITALQVF